MDALQNELKLGDGTVQIAPANSSQGSVTKPGDSQGSAASKLPADLDDLFTNTAQSAQSAQKEVTSAGSRAELIEQTLKDATTTAEKTADKVQATLAGAFGSPHISAPTAPAPAPPSPADVLPAKQLDFDLGKVPATPVSPGYPSAPAAAATAQVPATPVTPAGATIPAMGTGADSEGSIDYDTFVRETVLWTYKVRSAVYLVGGVAAIWLFQTLLLSDISLVTAVCNLLLLSCAFNCLRGFVSPKLQASSTWQNSAITNRTIETSTSLVKGAAELHDKHITGATSAKLLVMVPVLWAVSLTGRVVGTAGLAITLWILAFVVPKAYTMNKAKVDQTVKDITTQVKTQFMKLDPYARAALIVVPIFVAGYVLSWVDLAVALFIVVLYAFSFMLKPSQVERVNKMVASPIANGLTTVGGTVNRLVKTAVVKYDLTPTPAKAKRA